MKREKFLWPLSQSHHRGLVLAKKVRELAPEGDDKLLKELSGEIQRAYEGELRRHFRDEEEMLIQFEQMVGPKDPGAERVREDHRLLESLVPQATKESLALFAATLTDHIRFEEDVLFARLEKAFGQNEKEKWGETLREHAPRCPQKHRGQILIMDRPRWAFGPLVP